MATAISSVSLRFLFFAYLVSLCLQCFLQNGYAFEETETREGQREVHHAHTIQLSSLLPSPVCNHSTKASGRKSSLEVVHKHGPCFEPINGDKINTPSHAEMLVQDQARVNSIHSKLSKKSGSSDIKETDGATVPAKDGTSLGTLNYIVAVGLGTPQKKLSLVFDTGSDLTWTQCEPCLKYCYHQKEQIFKPSKSKTYTNVTCKTKECQSVESATGNSQGCIDSTCLYGIEYGDNSFSVGFFAKETLTLTSSDVFPNILFGCGQNNQGLFGKTAGLLGLGRNPISFVSQTVRKYKKFFSYCLPSSPSSTGHLTFGNTGGLPKSVKYTPLSDNSADSTFYSLDITGLSVGGQKLSISKSVFETAGTIIDSGTVITRLPPAAYSALRSEFRKFMAQAKYPKAPAYSILDTCYDFSNYDSITVPSISFFFKGNVEVSSDISGILYVVSQSQVCLAVAGNEEEGDAAIFGNVQQKTLEVVYDGARGRVGFAPGGCD